MQSATPRSRTVRVKLAQIAATALLTVPGAAGVPIRRQGAHSPTVRLRQVQQKRTEPVSPSSDNPTDLRRSECHSENHQPRALRTRCKPHTRGLSPDRQALRSRLVAICGVFFSHRVKLRLRALALVPLEENGRARRPGRKEFAEPGTLSSTFPTNRPLPRSAPRGASSYRRPVLGAAALYANPDMPIKSRVQENRRNLRPISQRLPAGPPPS